MFDSTRSLADPLSDILKLADAQPVLSGGFTAGGSWGIHFPKPERIKFFALVNGYCWLHIDEQEEPVRVEEGDVILLSAQRSFTLPSGVGVSPLDANDIFSGDRSKFAKIGEGEGCVQIGGHSDPGHPWHLEDLAKATAMSRTAFAMYFKKVPGVGPLTYLAEWRMRLAEHALREDKIFGF